MKLTIEKDEEESVDKPPRVVEIRRLRKWRVKNEEGGVNAM